MNDFDRAHLDYDRWHRYEPPPEPEDEDEEMVKLSERAELDELDRLRDALQSILDEFPRVVGINKDVAEEIRAKLHTIVDTLTEAGE